MVQERKCSEHNGEEKCSLGGQVMYEGMVLLLAPLAIVVTINHVFLPDTVSLDDVVGLV
jgi:hypothetical protein